MHNSDVYLENSRSAKPVRPGGHPGFGQRVSAVAREEELQRVEGMKIAQTAVQGIGMSTKEIRGTWMNSPNYALAVSLLFTRATNQRIMLGTEPRHVLSTSHLYTSLLHDSRFMQVPLSSAAPGDIVVQSGLRPDGYAGIVVDHGRIVSDSSQGVQNNSSLVELQRQLPPTLLFRYIGVQKYPGYTLALLANAGFNADEPRLPAGQPGGGQWTSGMAPSKTVLSGGNPRTTAQAAPAVQKANPEPGEPTKERAAEAKKFADLAEVYSEKAEDENQLAGPTAMVFDGVGQPDKRDRHKLAAKAAQDIAEELQRRAYILTNGTENNYRNLVIEKYGINNPNLNEIMAYYAKKFNDQATLNYLKLQHPAVPPSPDQIRKDVGMMALLPQFEKMGAAAGESPLTKPPEKGIFDKTTEIAEGKVASAGKNSGAPSNPSQPNYKAIEYVPETSSMMDENAAAYQDGAPASRYGMAPRLSGVDANGKITSKFDGVDPATGEMVDRKLNVVDRPNFIKEALRQSAVATQNGFTVRWEVPNEAVQAKAQRILSANGIKNIKVVVVPK